MMALQSRRSGSVQSVSGANNTLAFARDIESPVNLSSNPQEDPLRPLRTMADRVGKEVERFAERLDEWHGLNLSNDNAKTRYQTTLRMVAEFKDVADSTVEELQRQSDAEHRGELAKSTRRRIQNMADVPRPSIESGAGPVQSMTASEPKSSAVRELRAWQAESATWDLLRIIIEHYHPEPGTDVEDQNKESLKKTGEEYRHTQNTDIWNRFILKDDHAKEKTLILRWLEQTAEKSESDIPSITEELEKESGKDTNTWAAGWLDTRSKIKQEKRLRGSAGPLGMDSRPIASSDRTETLVCQLDPDAAPRQGRTLEKADEYYERALWMVCYEMVRRGKSWEEISEWCKGKNESWRAISLCAGYDTQPAGVPNLSGPSVGYLFRRVSYFNAKAARYHYERALYGLMSGDVRSVESVCRTWDDHLYARYNALLLSRFDSYLAENYPDQVPATLARKFVFQDIVASVGPWEESAPRTIDSLKEHKPTAAQAHSPLKLIQGSLIGRNIEELLVNVGAAIFEMTRKDSRHVNLIVDPNGIRKDSIKLDPPVDKCCRALASDPHALRIAVHIIIILRQGLRLDAIKDSSGSLAMDNVIAAYIEMLRLSRRIDMIPLYAAQFSTEARQHHCLGRILPDIKNSDDQKDFLRLMEECGLDPVDAVSENYQCVLKASGLLDGIMRPVDRYVMLEPTKESDWLWPGKRIKKNFFDFSTNVKEDAVLDCMEWYRHLQRFRGPTFLALTDAVKHLLLHGRLGAALKLTRSMSVEVMSLQKTKDYCGYSFDFTIPGTEEQDREALAEEQAKVNRDKRITISEEQHMQEVQHFRQISQSYHDLEKLCTLIELFSKWRAEEDKLIQMKATNAKPSTKNVRELFEAIDMLTESLLSGLLQVSSDGGIPFNEIDSVQAEDPAHAAVMAREHLEFSTLIHAYIPEIVLAYISVAQACSFFATRETAVKAMEMANTIAEENRKWLRTVFKRDGRMKELVEMLARASLGMVRLSEIEPGKAAGVKRRGSKGETVRIWDVNVRN
ncbi:hypothetical protein GQ43DRAFT_169155 [Delitschia confertaspora ATCC 74209]|uniref:Nuclear pore complex protein n=1 Tax=Delitschia confertaspora ATCC 74209 TaxID=1513339 RepID=A0A9P4JJE0_9PLEO|nr:hypothetical protein GQ43DRAFT_169155 [Delitschia confertaspora ATCC 74209]